METELIAARKELEGTITPLAAVRWLAVFCSPPPDRPERLTRLHETKRNDELKPFAKFGQRPSYVKLERLALYAMLLVVAQRTRRGGGSSIRRSGPTISSSGSTSPILRRHQLARSEKGPGIFQRPGRRHQLREFRKATEAKSSAEKQLKEAETKLANLEQEVAELRETAKRESAAEADRIRNLTRNRRAKNRTAAQRGN